MNRSRAIQTITINKTVSVDIEEEVNITSSDIIEAIENMDDMAEFLRNAGYIPIEDFGLSGTIIDQIKLDIMNKILAKATISQLEIFEKSI